MGEDVLGCGVKGERIDLCGGMNEDGKLVVYKWEEEEGKDGLWDSSGELVGEGLEEVYGGIEFGMGGGIEKGF